MSYEYYISARHELTEDRFKLVSEIRFNSMSSFSPLCLASSGISSAVALLCVCFLCKSYRYAFCLLIYGKENLRLYRYGIAMRIHSLYILKLNQAQREREKEVFKE